MYNTGLGLVANLIFILKVQTWIIYKCVYNMHLKVNLTESQKVTRVHHWIAEASNNGFQLYQSITPSNIFTDLKMDKQILIPMGMSLFGMATVSSPYLFA